MQTHWLPVLLMMSAALGCGSAAVEKMGGGGPPVPWEAADKFDGQDGFMPVAYAADYGQWSRAKQVAGNENFEKAVNEFAEAPVPEDWVDRADERDQAVEELRALIKAARDGSMSDFQAAYQKSVESLQRVRAPREEM